MLWQVILFFFLLAAAVGFAIQNDQPVTLKYYLGLVSISLPLFLWIFLFILAGLMTAGFLGFFSKLSLRSRIRRLKKEVDELEKRTQEDG
jgi:uncharacterized integral membrane protein